MVRTLLNSPVVYDQNVILVDGIIFEVMDSIQHLFPIWSRNLPQSSLFNFQQ